MTSTRPPDAVRHRRRTPAVDWNTGRIVWKKQYGSGLTANKNYSSIALGPDGSLYADALIRLFRVSDGS